MRISYGTKIGMVSNFMDFWKGEEHFHKLSIVCSKFMNDCRRSAAFGCVAGRQQSADSSLRGAESAVTVRHDAHHIDDHFHADYFPAISWSRCGHRGRMPDIDVDLFAAAGAEGATAGL